VTDRTLVCSGCGRASHDEGQRFCDACGMPLVPEGEAQAPSEERERAMKVQPAYAEGDLVKVAYAHNQPEAELIAGLLLEEGIPCVVRRARGFDVPDFLAAGPRDIFVAEGGHAAAREVLGSRGEPRATVPPSLRGVALAMLVIAGVSILIAVVAAALV
jgi:hypothetical protein